MFGFMKKSSVVLGIAASILCGCASIPSEPLYASPAAIPQERLAFVYGSMTKTSWPLENEVTFIAAVDLDDVVRGNHRAGRDSYLKPISLSEGLHHLTIVFSQGQTSADATVPVRVLAGQRLIAKASTSESKIEKMSITREYVMLWIEDLNTGALLSEKVKRYRQW